MVDKYMGYLQVRRSSRRFLIDEIRANLAKTTNPSYLLVNEIKSKDKRLNLETKRCFLFFFKKK